METERCILRDWRPDDASRVLDIYSRWEVARWLGATPRAMETPEEAARFVTRCNELNRSEPVARRWAYATETALAALRWAFDHGLDEVFAVVRPGNDASIAVCRRLRMVSLGRTTAYYDTESELFRITKPETP